MGDRSRARMAHATASVSLAVVVAADDLAAVVDDRRPTAEGIDRRLGVRVQVVRPDVARDQVEVVVQGPRPVLDLEQPVAGVRVGVRTAVHHLSAVHRKAARVLRVGPLVGHEEPQPPDGRVGDGIERIERPPVQLDPLVPDVVRRHGVLNRQQRNHLAAPEDDPALGGQHEPDVEEPSGEFRMPRLRLRHEIGVPLPRQRAERIGLGLCPALRCPGFFRLYTVPGLFVAVLG